MNKKIRGGTKMKKKLSRVFMASMLMVTAMGLVACGKESGENENNVNVNIVRKKINGICIKIVQVIKKRGMIKYSVNITAFKGKYKLK